MSFPLEKYKFYVNPKEKKVYAVSSYCGRKVCGTATCAPDDEFDLEKGKKLAAARCNLKVAEKRLRRAARKHNESGLILQEVRRINQDMQAYHADASKAFDEACDELSHLLETF